MCVALNVKCCNNGEYLITKTIILLKCVAGGNSAELCEIVASVCYQLVANICKVGWNMKVIMADLIILQNGDYV